MTAPHIIFIVAAGLAVLLVLFMKFRLHALPVVDGSGAMEGIVAFEHAFDELLPRLARLAG